MQTSKQPGDQGRSLLGTWVSTDFVRANSERLPHRRWLLVVVQEAENVVVLEAVAALEEVELDGEGQPGDLAA